MEGLEEESVDLMELTVESGQGERLFEGQTHKMVAGSLAYTEHVPAQFQYEVEASTSNETETDIKCPFCKTTRDPSFGHYRMGNGQNKKGAVIWRYRCSIRQCLQFFGPLYKYNSKENSFDVIEEDELDLKTGEFNENSEDVYAEVEDVKIDGGEDVEGDAGEIGDGEHVNIEGLNASTSIIEEDKGHDAEVSARKRKSLRTVTNRKRTTVPEVNKMAVSDDASEKHCNSHTKNGLPMKRLKKGYVWETVDSRPAAKGATTTNAQASSVTTNNAKKPVKRKHEQSEQSQATSQLKPAEKRPIKSSYTQTGDTEHVAAALMQELVREETRKLCGTLRTEEDIDASNNSVRISGHVTRRMLIGKMIVGKQSARITSLEEENEKLRAIVGQFREAFHDLRTSHVEAMRNLKDDVIFLKREFQFHHNEMLAECKRSLMVTKKDKEDTRIKCEAVQQQNDSLKSLLETREERVEMEKQRADELARQVLLKERDQHLAEVERDEANDKLADSLFLANNVKCAHCVSSSKMKEILSMQVKEKSLQAQQAISEKNDMRRKLENAEKIAHILHKDNAKLQYEAKTWRSSCDKLRSMLAEKTTSEPLDSSALLQSATPSSGIDTSTPSLDTSTPGQHSNTGSENAQTATVTTTTGATSTTTGGSSKDSPPEDGEITANSPLPSTSNSNTPDYHLPPPPRPPVTIKSGQEKHVNASSNSPSNALKPRLPPMPHFHASSKMVSTDTRSSSSQSSNGFSSTKFYSPIYSSKAEKKKAKFERRRIRELEKVVEDEKEKQQQQQSAAAEKRKEDNVQSSVRKHMRLPMRSLERTVKPTPASTTLSMARIPKKSETEARRKEEEEEKKREKERQARQRKEEERRKAEEESKKKIEEEDWKKEMNRQRMINESASKNASTYNGPVWSNMNVPARSRRPSSPLPNSSMAMPTFDLNATHPLPWHANAAHSHNHQMDVPPRMQSNNVPFNAWAAREESWGRPTGWTNSDSWTPESSNWGGHPVQGPGPGSFFQHSGPSAPPFSRQPDSYTPLPPRPVIRRNFWDM